MLGVKVGSAVYYGVSGDSGILTYDESAFTPVVEIIGGITLAKGNNTCYGLIHVANGVKTIYTSVANSFRILWIIQ